MAGRFARSFALAKASWSVVQADKELLLLPLISVAALVVILGSLAVPVVVLGGIVTGGVPGDPGLGMMLGLLLLYVLFYFITLFFNTALVGAAMMRMDGGNPTLGDGLRIAWQRAGRILGYACIAATVGLLLRALEERVGWFGQVVTKLIGAGWALATFLVVPVIVTRDAGPIEAVKESAGLLRRTWGENLIGNVGLGLVFGIGYAGLAIVALFVFMATMQSGLTAGIVLAIALTTLAILMLVALHAALQGVYSAALFRYATGHGAPLPGLGPDALGHAFGPRK